MRKGYFFFSYKGVVRVGSSFDYVKVDWEISQELSQVKNNMVYIEVYIESWWG